MFQRSRLRAGALVFALSNPPERSQNFTRFFQPTEGFLQVKKPPASNSPKFER